MYLECSYSPTFISLLTKEAVCAADVVTEAEHDLYLSPQSRLLADSPEQDDYVYDGCGHLLVRHYFHCLSADTVLDQQMHTCCAVLLHPVSAMCL